MESIKYPEKIYFGGGDRVTIKHDIPFKPVMLVIGKVTKTFRDKGVEGDATHFQGMKCFWFTTDLVYQEQVFNTKDLIHVV